MSCERAQLSTRDRLSDSMWKNPKQISSLSLYKVMSRQIALLVDLDVWFPLKWKYIIIWNMMACEWNHFSSIYVPWPSVKRLTQKWEMEKEDHEKQQKSSTKRKPKLIITIINFMCKIGLSPLMGFVKSKTDCGRVIKGFISIVLINSKHQ